ncbi:calcium-binding EF-hand family protein [Striga asiatica]|uniref:Calcium-binding EF-hand family protein n=1 Tax=Striga asiatica TaxID=4170 RepID=A0A5A7PQZ6_STRAF|nr:calcium-binding EF-hand family protein [Striga asiatica]
MTTTAVPATVHSSTGRRGSVIPFSRLPRFSVRPSRVNFSCRVKCAVLHETRRDSRRSVSISLVFLHFFSLSKDASGASMLDKYVKKKKLDPLEAYIPAVILTELQIKELGKYLEVDQPKFADCRSFLRSGPAASLRINIRAVAQYASDAGNGKSAFDEVDRCLRALEELDSLLLRASRNDSGATVEPMKLKVVTTIDSLNSLLKTVPADVLDKGKAMADAYLAPGDELAPENFDPQLKQLESLL